jgi:dipeptidyl aminopeptidase/acylaminoacyl peptidase
MYVEGRWSPDGNWISLIKEDQEKGRFLEITTPHTYNPITVCSFPEMIKHSWAPNGQKITFLSSNAQDPDYLKMVDYTYPSYKVSGITIARTGKDGLIPTRLHVVDMNIKEKKFSKPYPLTPLDISLKITSKIPYSWSPDSQQIVFSFLLTDKSSKDSKMALIDVDTKRIKVFEHLGDTSDAVFSPNGDIISFVSPSYSSFQTTQKSNEFLIRASTISLFDTKSEKVRELAQTPNGRPSIIGWMANGLEILVEDDFRTTRALYSVPINGQIPTPLSMQSVKDFRAARLNFSSTYLSLVGENLNHAPEVYISPLKEFNLHQLTNVHKAFPNFSDIKSEIIKWTSFDGKEIEGILVYSKGYKKGKTMPILVCLHGGPPYSWKQRYLGFDEMVSFASLSDRGFGVFAPNVRGSSGYGSPFRQAIYKDWVNGPFNDIMTGVDFLIEKGIVNSEQLAIAGGSYGGDLAAWAITQTDRFKVAIIHAGTTYLLSGLCGSLSNWMSDGYFGGQFWDNYGTVLENSPIMRVEKIKTPTLIQHGEKDDTVDFAQGKLLCQALKSRDVPVHMSIYFNQGHGLSGKASSFGAEEILSWLDRYVKPHKWF